MSEDNRRRSDADGAMMNEQINRQLVELLARVTADQNNASMQKQNQVRHDDTEDSIDLIALFWRLVANLHYILLAALIGALIAFIWVNTSLTPMYKATSKLYIVSNNNAIIQMADLQIGTALISDYREVFATWEVSEMVRSSLNLPYSYSKLQSMLSVTNPNGSRVLYLTVTSSDPQEAADIANAFADSGRQFIMQSMSTNEPNSFSVALVPSVPSSRGKTTYIIMGFLIGTLLAAAVVVIQFLMDDHPKTAEDIAGCCGLPTLAVIPVIKEESPAQNRARARRKKGE